MFELFSVISKEKTKKNIIYMVGTNIVHPCVQKRIVFSISKYTKYFLSESFV